VSRSSEASRNSVLILAIGDLCGAVYLDENFQSQIRTIVGEKDYDRLDSEIKAKVFENDWEFAAKRKYTGSQNVSFQVDIPGYKPKKSRYFGLGKKPNSAIILDP